jgi:aminoglycoside/choline kinase family phosphotransferase
MSEHYMRLLTDVELNDAQKQAWYRVVEKLLSAEYVTQPTN